MVRYAQTDKKEGVVLLYLGLLLLAGILQGVMVSLNGQMGNYFSLFGMPVTRIRRRQLPGYALVLLGVILVVLN